MIRAVATLPQVVGPVTWVRWTMTDMVKPLPPGSWKLRSHVWNYKWYQSVWWKQQRSWVFGSESWLSRSLKHGVNLGWREAFCISQEEGKPGKSPKKVIVQMSNKAVQGGVGVSWEHRGHRGRPGLSHKILLSKGSQVYLMLCRHLESLSFFEHEALSLLFSTWYLLLVVSVSMPGNRFFSVD